MAGSFCYYPVAAATPREAGYGQAGEIIGAVAAAGATAYQLYLQRMQMLQAKHAADRAAAAAQAAQTAAAAQAQAQVAQAQAGLTPGGITSMLPPQVGAVVSQVPWWGWAAGAGALVLLVLRR